MPRKFVLAAMATLLALLAAEAGLRLVGLEMHDVQREMRFLLALVELDTDGETLIGPRNADIRMWGYSNRFNSYGMRDEEPVVPKPRGTRRILFLGDSFTYGQGVAQEQTFPYRVRESLHDRSAAVDVVVAGVPAWNTQDELRFVRNHVGALDPDVVVLTYVINDREDVNPLLEARRRSPSFWTAAYRQLVRHSRLAELAAYAYVTYSPTAAAATLEEFFEWYRAIPPVEKRYSADDQGWLQSRAALDEIAARLQQRGARLLLILDALSFDLSRERMVDQLESWGEAHHVPVVDMLTYFGDRPLDELRRSGVRDPHPNREAHELIAKGVVSSLVDRGMVER